MAYVDTLVALVHFGNDWHSGGGSREYRLMCRAARALARRGVGSGGYAVLDNRRLKRSQREAYNLLRRRFGCY